MRFHVPMQRRWRDLDTYGHVNNATIIAFLEEARLRTFGLADEDSDEPRPLGTERPSTDPATFWLVARHEIEYVTPIPYRSEPLDVQLWVSQLKGASLTVEYAMCEPGEERSYVRASTEIVLVDSTTNRPRRIRDDERAVWEPYLGPATQFRRRPS